MAPSKSIKDVFNFNMCIVPLDLIHGNQWQGCWWFDWLRIRASNFDCRDRMLEINYMTNASLD